VAAVNDLGQSEPLVTDKPITAKHPFGIQDKSLPQGHYRL